MVLRLLGGYPLPRALPRAVSSAHVKRIDRDPWREIAQPLLFVQRAHDADKRHEVGALAGLKMAQGRHADAGLGCEGVLGDVLLETQSSDVLTDLLREFRGGKDLIHKGYN